MEVPGPEHLAEFDWKECKAWAYINGVKTFTDKLRPKVMVHKNEEQLAKSPVVACFDGPGVYLYLARLSVFAFPGLR